MGKGAKDWTGGFCGQKAKSDEGGEKSREKVQEEERKKSEKERWKRREQ